MNEKTSFSKQAKSTRELISQLKDRGMTIDNDAFALDVLNKVNYYRLSGYWFKFQNKWLKKNIVPVDLSLEEKDRLNNLFVVDVSFANIVDIYKFDTKLRSLCLDALEKIEIAVGTYICEHMCNTKGGYWFLDKENIQPVIKRQKDGTDKCIFSHEVLLADIDEVVKRNIRTKCIKNFQRKYDDQYPPYWILAQLITFGTLSKLYTSLHPQDKKQIAKNIGLNIDIMEKSLQTLAYVRNVCAHYARLWDNENSVTPVNIRFNPIEYNSKYNYCFHSNGSNTTFFPIFYLITFYLKNIYPKSKWCKLIASKIKEYQDKTITSDGCSLISFKGMGFPDNWEKLPLFTEMLQNG